MLLRGKAAAQAHAGHFGTPMFDYSVHFDRPIYLWLLAVLPLFWIIGFRSLAALGSVRRWLALLLRTTVAAMLILAVVSGYDYVRRGAGLLRKVAT